MYGEIYASRFLGPGSKRAHRVSYETFVGPIPAGLTLDHLCRNTLCINPAHLEPVTIKENVLRGDGPTARNARKTHCDRGHAFDETNTGPNANGGRSCRACKREWVEQRANGRVAAPNRRGRPATRAGLLATSQQWTPEQRAWLAARAQRLCADKEAPGLSR